MHKPPTIRITAITSQNLEILKGLEKCIVEDQLMKKPVRKQI